MARNAKGDDVVPPAPPLAVVRGSYRHVDAVFDAVRAATSEMHRLGIAQWDDEYPSREVLSAAVENGSLFLCMQGGKVVVGAGLDAVQPPEYASCNWRHGVSALVVHHLVVHPDYWRMGYAGRFMEFAERYASSLKHDAMRLDAYSANAAALSLYRSRGYREAGEVVFPRRTRPFICFEKKLVHSEREG
ncbi:MAG: hypothetical protein CME43_11260 [Haliea sp.]|uniref:GNAT family N-acetyltransferase n=1 Tax=Haliea sp. TaxID=1932666 RepID=UPI000C3AA786|nr:GNAT family N-acetyltransferase [Haliea sp.]MBM70042.1 hypothetical protein [Haliea sp.]|tara:strand:- start:2293 stop:2859 length:567 start_codon:yes stop_codon:yes gene_type:complete